MPPSLGSSIISWSLAYLSKQVELPEEALERQRPVELLSPKATEHSGWMSGSCRKFHTKSHHFKMYFLLNMGIFHCYVCYRRVGGGFEYVFIFTPKFGEMFQFDFRIFSKWVVPNKPPPRKRCWHQKKGWTNYQTWDFLLPLSTTLRLVNWAWWYELNHFLGRLVGHMDSIWIRAWKMEERSFETIICEFTKKIRIAYVNSHSWFMFLNIFFGVKCESTQQHPTIITTTVTEILGLLPLFFSRSARAHLHHLPLCHPTLRHGTTACPSGEL